MSTFDMAQDLTLFTSFSCVIYQSTSLNISPNPIWFLIPKLECHLVTFPVNHSFGCSGFDSQVNKAIKAANQQERIKLWKQHFENLLGNPPKITHEPITRIISKQLDIKLGPFTQEELDSVLRKIKNRKAAGLDEIPPEV